MSVEPMVYIFKINPVGKPRMTQSDKWNERPPVMRYLAFKQELNIKANLQKYRLDGDELIVEFYIPMPKSWSPAKKLQMNGKKHLEKPDGDNLAKAFSDALTGEDKGFWHWDIKKFWSLEGKIVVFKDVI